MLNVLLGFGGRIGRLEYFLFSCGLAIFAGLLVVMIFSGLMPHGWLSMDPVSRKEALVRPLLITLLTVGPFFLWFSFALQAKRFRDMGWNPLVTILGWIGLMAADRIVTLVVPSVALGTGHSTVFGLLFNLGMCLCLWFWPSAPGGAGATFDPRIFDENWSDTNSARIPMPAAAPRPVLPAAAAAAAPQRPGFGRRGL